MFFSTTRRSAKHAATKGFPGTPRRAPPTIFQRITTERKYYYYLFDWPNLGYRSNDIRNTQRQIRFPSNSTRRKDRQRECRVPPSYIETKSIRSNCRGECKKITKPTKSHQIQDRYNPIFPLAIGHIGENMEIKTALGDSLFSIRRCG